MTKHKTPLLDQLESGPWPTFVQELKDESAEVIYQLQDGKAVPVDHDMSRCPNCMNCIADLRAKASRLEAEVTRLRTALEKIVDSADFTAPEKMFWIARDAIAAKSQNTTIQDKGE